MRHDPNPGDFRDSYGNPIAGGTYAVKGNLDQLIDLNPGPSRITGNWGAHRSDDVLREGTWLSPEDTTDLTPVALGGKFFSDVLMDEYGKLPKRSLFARAVCSLLEIGPE